jgi:uncharacterized protein
MNEDAEFSGPITASFKFSSEIDSHFVAQLGRIDRAGVYHLLSLGTTRPALRKIDTKRSTATEIAIEMDVPEPLIPNEPVTLKFSLTPQPVLLKTGERLRFDVGSRKHESCDLGGRSLENSAFLNCVPQCGTRWRRERDSDYSLAAPALDR